MTTLGTEDTVLSTYIAAHKLDAILAAPGIAGTAAAGNKESIPCDQCAPLVATLETQLRTAAELGQVLLARHSAQAAAAQHAARRHADAETALKEMELARVRAENDCDTAERAQKAAAAAVGIRRYAHSTNSSRPPPYHLTYCKPKFHIPANNIFKPINSSAALAQTFSNQC
ncbi:hypothetical protein DV495_003642 [Geotrichum candidum]|nr:hypothetical protein DV452_003555 [Geotrichum candidum]KAF5124918.1 hypothetical protein DV495_003642 [Geotrichum candidum]KAI9210874.1 hypothetical protein DS838_004252 [Geotrichum bryndzae]